MSKKTELCPGASFKIDFAEVINNPGGGQEIHCPGCTSATERIAELERENERLPKVPEWFEKKMVELEEFIEGPKVAPSYKADARLQHLQMKQMELLLNAGDLEHDLAAMKALTGELASVLEASLGNMGLGLKQEAKALLGRVLLLRI